MNTSLRKRYHERVAGILGRYAHERAASEPEGLFNLRGHGTSSTAAWFLGPKAENEHLLKGLLIEALRDHCTARRDYFPDDPIYVTEEIKHSREYEETAINFARLLKQLLNELRGSVPFWSYRWQSHMNWDLTMPSMVGYFAAMLYNPNNVAAEASPVTTMLEMLVGDDFCRMLGYEIPPPDDREAIRPWGHITCDGSVANLESIWASRNLKLYPITVAQGLKNNVGLSSAKYMAVPLPRGGRAPLVELSNWELLNLRIDDILALAPRLNSEYGISPIVLDDSLARYSVQNIGLTEFCGRFLSDMPALRMFGPATMHYSWPKGAAIVGIGSDNVVPIDVDSYARMDVVHLRQELDKCLANRQPVTQVVAVLGSTEESAVDPLADVVRLHEDYRQVGLEFELHVDGAWGGYFSSILRPDIHATVETSLQHSLREYAPAMCMSPYVTEQYKALPAADSVTIDPHKAGYTPYPSGGLCYRNGSMRYLVAFTAPVVYHGGVDPTVGVYGVEGSKPGAAAAGVYLSHRVIRTDQSGYGKVLGQSFWSSKRLYAALVTMAGPEDNFIVVPFQRVPAEATGQSADKVKAQLEYIGMQIVPKTNDELLADPEAMALFRQLGSDQIILSYSFNFRHKDGTINDRLDLANSLNNDIFTALSLQKFEGGHVPDVPMFVTCSQFDPKTYGQSFVDLYARRLGVQPAPGEAVAFLITTTMDPWLSDTAEGSFIPRLIEVLRRTVVECAAHSIIISGHS